MEKRKKIFFYIVSILITYSIILNIFKISMLPSIRQYGEHQCETLYTKILNYTIENDLTNEIKEKIVFYNNDDEIVSLDFNTSILNSISSNMIRKMQMYYDKLSKNNLDGKIIKEIGIETNSIYKIPFSMVLKNPLFSSIGPDIPIRYRNINNVVGQLTTNLKEYGINNTLIEINLNITVNAIIDIPISSEKIKFEVSSPLVVKLIQGKVPDAFYGTNVIGGVK